MGVPGFYSWLIKRYPLCYMNLSKGEAPVIDCLYLDMNGILYKCRIFPKIINNYLF